MGVNETIASLVLAYIGLALFNHLVEGPLRDPASLNKPSTYGIGDANMLGSVPGTDAASRAAGGCAGLRAGLGADLTHQHRLRGARHRRQHARGAVAGAAGGNSA